MREYFGPSQDQQAVISHTRPLPSWNSSVTTPQSSSTQESGDEHLSLVFQQHQAAIIRTLTDYEKVSEIYQLWGYVTWTSPSTASQGRECGAPAKKKYVSVNHMPFHTIVVEQTD